MFRTIGVALVALSSTAAFAQNAEPEISAGRGAEVAIIGGCHDCHTTGYAANNGEFDAAVALTGDAVGFQGPWGTTYPANLRIVAGDKTEDEWVEYLKTFKARPPMPWFNVHHLAEADMRSLYQYIKSLGEPGEPAPEFVEPGGTPKTPFIVFAPPQMPQ